MPYSYTNFTGDGVTTNRNVSFPYLDQADITVKVNGVSTAFSWLTANTIQISPAPANGAIGEIRRTSLNSSPIVEFQDASVLTEDQLNLLALYDQYIAEEAADAIGQTISQDSTGVFQGQNRRAANFADPTSAQDLTTKSYVDAGDAAGINAAATATTQAGIATTQAGIATIKAAEAAASAATIGGFDLTGTPAQEDSILWDTTAGKYLRRSFAYLKTALGFTAFGTSLVGSAAASNARSTLGLGTAATVNTGSSGATIPLCNVANTFAAGQVLPDPALTGKIHHTVEGRLTVLGGGNPVTTSDINSGFVFFTPYKGNQVGLYVGGTWVLRNFTEQQLTLASGYTSGNCYDVFAYDNAGTLNIESLAWTNSTTRATSLGLQDGVLCKGGDPTRRYLGTFYMISGTTTEDSNQNRYLYNHYNKVERAWYKQQTSSASWTYTTATFRQANADTNNQINCCIGVSEDMIELNVHCNAQNSTAGVAVAVGIGINSTTTNSAFAHGSGCGPVGGAVPSKATLQMIPSPGKNSFVWLEYSTATGTTTWQGFTGQFTSSIWGRMKS